MPVVSQEPRPGYRFVLRRECGIEASVRLHEHVGIEALVDAFQGFLLACGFDQSLVNEALGREQEVES